MSLQKLFLYKKLTFFEFLIILAIVENVISVTTLVFTSISMLFTACTFYYICINNYQYYAILHVNNFEDSAEVVS